MPSNLTGLLIFVAFFVPGFIYLARSEKFLAARQYSTLREAGVVVSASVAAIGTILAALLLVEAVCPCLAPDFDSLVNDGSAHAKEHYASLALWTIGILAAASLLCFIAASPPSIVSSVAAKAGLTGLEEYVTDRNVRPIRTISGWDNLFQLHNREGRVLVDIRLINDWVYRGTLLTYSTQIVENSDRSITIIEARELLPGAEDFVDIDGGAMIVAASQVRTINAFFYPKVD